jgi:glycerol kinase
MQEATALGVAMAAGYAIGIWDLDVDNRNDEIDVFKPTISEKERAKKFKRWNEAVSHSMHWIHSDEQDGVISKFPFQFLKLLIVYLLF